MIVGSLTPLSLADRYRTEISTSGAKLPGRLDHNGVAEVLQQARVGLCLLYSTRQYQLAEPTKLFEYLSMGLPIVGADMGPTAQIVRRHECGILVDAQDPKAIANAIKTILLDQDLATTYRRRALEAAPHYTWEAQAERLVCAYKRLLD